MSRSLLVAALSLAVAASFQRSGADEVRYYDQDGKTYRETTTYCPKYTTEMKETQRPYMAAVTEYRWTPCMERGWNPFAAPYLTYRYIPQTHWEPRSETVRVPDTRCEMVAQKRVEQVQSPQTQTASVPASASVPVGGIARIVNDPPREGTNAQPSGTIVR